jgi:hypothetical protein
MRPLSFGLLLFAFVFLNAQCGRDDCEVVPGGKNYYAWVPVSYLPMQERFKIGDTITVEIQVPTELKDTTSGEILPVGDVDIHDYFRGGDIAGLITRIIKTPDDSTRYIYAEREFDYIEQKGKVRVLNGSGGGLALWFLREADKTRTAKFQIVPRRTGIYVILFTVPELDVSKQIDDPYCAAGLQLFFGEPVAHNYHLLQEFDVKKVGTYEQNRGSFTFIVEE